MNFERAIKYFSKVADTCTWRLETLKSPYISAHHILPYQPQTRLNEKNSNIFYGSIIQ